MSKRVAKAQQKLLKGKVDQKIFGLPDDIQRYIYGRLGIVEVIRLRQVCKLAKIKLYSILDTLALRDNQKRLVTKTMFERIQYFTALKSLSIPHESRYSVSQEITTTDLTPLTRLQNLESLSLVWYIDRTFIECCLAGRNNPKHCWPKLTYLNSLALRPPVYNGPAQKKAPPKVPPGYLAKVFPSLKSTTIRSYFEPSEFELQVRAKLDWRPRRSCDLIGLQPHEIHKLPYYLQILTNIRSLSIQQNDFFSVDAEAFAPSLVRLTHFGCSLANSNTTETGPYPELIFSKLTSLESIDIQISFRSVKRLFNTHLSNLSVLVLNNLPLSLRKLHLVRVCAPQPTLVNFVAQLTRLVSLRLTWVDIQDDTLQSIVDRHFYLTELDVSGCKLLTPKSLCQLTKLSSLTSLAVGGTTFDDCCLKAWSAHPQLKALSIQCCRALRYADALFSGFNNLSYIQMRHTRALSKQEQDNFLLRPGIEEWTSYNDDCHCHDDSQPGDYLR